MSKRPERWDFAMDFLGEPENKEVEAYVESLVTERDRYRDELFAVLDGGGFTHSATVGPGLVVYGSQESITALESALKGR